MTTERKDCFVLDEDRKRKAQSVFDQCGSILPGTVRPCLAFPVPRVLLL